MTLSMRAKHTEDGQDDDQHKANELHLKSRWFRRVLHVYDREGEYRRELQNLPEYKLPNGVCELP